MFVHEQADVGQLILCNHQQSVNWAAVSIALLKNTSGKLDWVTQIYWWLWACHMHFIGLIKTNFLNTAS
jgi:hypothetical protein